MTGFKMIRLGVEVDWHRGCYEIALGAVCAAEVVATTNLVEALCILTRLR